MTLVGMDPELVRALAARLDSEAGRLGTVLAAVDAQVARAQSSWQGPDAARFSTSWRATHRPAVAALHTALTELATTARRNATQQDVTSGDLTGLAGVPAAGALPGAPGGPAGPQPGGGASDASDPGGPDSGDRGDGGDGGDGENPYAEDPGHGIDGYGAQAQGTSGRGYAQGSAFWGLHAGADGSGSLLGIPLQGGAYAAAGAQAAGHASAGLGPLGLGLGASGSAMAGLTAAAHGSIGGGPLKGVGSAEVQAGAAADGDLGLDLGNLSGSHGREWGSSGDDGWAFDGHAGGSATLGASATGTAGVDVLGVTPKASASAYAGLHADAGADVGYHNGHFTVDGHLGAALGLGFGVNVSVDVDPGQVVHDLNPANWF